MIRKGALIESSTLGRHGHNKPLTGSGCLSLLWRQSLSMAAVLDCAVRDLGGVGGVGELADARRGPGGGLGGAEGQAGRWGEEGREEDWTGSQPPSPATAST